MPRFTHGRFCLLFFLKVGLAQNFTVIDPNECVAPSAYMSCYNGVVEATTKCEAEFSNNHTAQKGCACVDGEEKINCFAQSCWNHVYGCKYQFQVDYYLSECDSGLPSDIPFWPAPNNAPGSCSCNTGVIIETKHAAELDYTKCLGGAIDNADKQYECACCAYSVRISALFDICPNYSINSAISYLLPNGSESFGWSNCTSYLQKVNCGDLGFVAPLSTGVLFAPTNTPAMGTQTLSDKPGEVTAPPSGTLFSWTGYVNTWTVTALSAEYYEGATSTRAGGATVIGGDTVTGALGGSTTASGAVATSAGSVSGSGSSSSTTKNAAQCLQPGVVAVFGLLIALGFYLFL